MNFFGNLQLIHYFNCVFTMFSYVFFKGFFFQSFIHQIVFETLMKTIYHLWRILTQDLGNLTSQWLFNLSNCSLKIQPLRIYLIHLPFEHIQAKDDNKGYIVIKVFFLSICCSWYIGQAISFWFLSDQCSQTWNINQVLLVDILLSPPPCFPSRYSALTIKYIFETFYL